MLVNGSTMIDGFSGERSRGEPAGGAAAEGAAEGAAALARTRAALRPDGILAIWSEDPDARFERELARAGFAARRERPGRGGRRHVVYVARRR